MSTKKEEKTPICCEKFNPAPWNGKLFHWHDKLFVTARVFTFFYMPINFGAVISRLIGAVEKSKGATPDSLCLSEHTSKWNMNIYLAVDRPINGLENTSLSGEFLSKVYEGDFRDTGKWCEDFAIFAKQRNKIVEKMYMWYTTCPDCAKKYSKNYVVIIARIS
jgi:hypothetical protein